MTRQDMGRRDGPGGSKRTGLSKLMTETGTVSARFAIVERFSIVTRLNRPLAPNRMPVVPVPVEPPSVDFPIEIRRLSDEVIVRGACRDGPSKGRLTQQRPIIQCSRVHPARRDNVQVPPGREDAPARGVAEIARLRVKNHPLLQLNGLAFRGADIDRASVGIKQLCAERGAEISISVGLGGNQAGSEFTLPL